jgi:hypothetical protein
LILIISRLLKGKAAVGIIRRPTKMHPPCQSRGSGQLGLAGDDRNPLPLEGLESLGKGGAGILSQILAFVPGLILRRRPQTETPPVCDLLKSREITGNRVDESYNGQLPSRVDIDVFGRQRGLPATA